MLHKLELDEDLLHRYATQGDETAFDVLYRRHRRRLWGMARKMGKDYQQAEDILVEAMAAVAQAARAGRIRGSFIGYSLTAVHHRGLHVLERANERRARATVPLALTLSAGGPTPEEAYSRGRVRSQVSAALDSLPDQQRRAVWLVDCQGLTYKEAAAALGCSEATIKRRLRAGRRTLALLLQHLDPGRAQAAKAEGEVG